MALVALVMQPRVTAAANTDVVVRFIIGSCKFLRPRYGEVVCHDHQSRLVRLCAGAHHQPAAMTPNPESDLARALRAYTRSTSYFMACARKDAMRHDLDGRAVEPVSEEHRTGAAKAVQGRRRRSSGQQRVGDAAA